MAERRAAVRLRRSRLDGPGYHRRRRGRGFSYLDRDGLPVTDPVVLDRLRALVLPPAWRDVWICPWPNGHIQAVGTDAAGRRQYRYHEAWRARRDAGKHERALRLAERLPKARLRAAGHLAGRGLTRERVLAACFRLLDLGFFRVGGEEYADTNGSYGLATLRREHVRVEDGELVFAFPAKGGKACERVLVDEDVRAVVTALRRAGGGDRERLFRFRSADGSRIPVHADMVNAYIGELTGGDFTAKDFRTWHATVLAAVGLAVSGGAADTPTARRRAETRVVREVAGYLGNTPAVARSSYIDPRVFERYREGTTVARALSRLGDGVRYGDLATRGAMERAVLRLLRD